MASKDPVEAAFEFAVTGRRWAVAMAAAMTRSFEISDTQYAYEISDSIFDEMYELAGGDETGPPNVNLLRSYFAAYSQGLATMLDAAHEACGYKTAEERLAAIQEIALTSEEIESERANRQSEQE